MHPNLRGREVRILEKPYCERQLTAIGKRTGCDDPSLCDDLCGGRGLLELAPERVGFGPASKRPIAVGKNWMLIDGARQFTEALE